jgi:dihydropteroate synthase
MKSYTLTWDSQRLELGRRTLIMGIVNVTPDSFSDGGDFFSTDDAVRQGETLARQGADILDIGGESTRPFSEPVSVEEEIRRVVPVIEKLARRIAIPISIDTNKAAVASRALDAGASMINDVSALRLDPAMGRLAAQRGVPLVLMHMLGTPKTMQVDPAYDDLFSDIQRFLAKAVAHAEDCGVARSRLIIDPGIGFGKTVQHNLQLIAHIDRLAGLDLPILVGPSRKAFIRKILKNDDQKDLRPDLPIVETGTQAVIAALALKGVHMVRVHHVANTVATLKMIDALKDTES